MLICLNPLRSPPPSPSAGPGFASCGTGRTGEPRSRPEPALTFCRNSGVGTQNAVHRRLIREPFPMSGGEVRGHKAGRPARITPRDLCHVVSPRRRPAAGNGLKSPCIGTKRTSHYQEQPLAPLAEEKIEAALKHDLQITEEKPQLRRRAGNRPLGNLPAPDPRSMCCHRAIAAPGHHEIDLRPPHAEQTNQSRTEVSTPSRRGRARSDAARICTTL